MFDLLIAKNELLPRLLIVAGAVDKRQSLAILSNILFKIENNNLFLTATDLEMEISAKISCDSIKEEGQITIPAKKFIDIIRSLDDEVQVNMRLQAETVVVKAARSQFKLSTLPAEQFPSSDNEASEINFSLPKSQLVYLFQSTHFAMSQQDVRIFLNGLLFDLDGLTLTTVGTDGHRMAICKSSLDTHLSQYRFLLPRKGVLEMLRLLNSIDDETISIKAGKNHFSLITDDYKITSKLIDARFPPYNKAIPTDNDKFVLVEKDSLKKALSRIVILAHEKSRAVLLQIQPNSITLIANNQDQEEAIESIEAQVDGTELKIGINASYLLDVLNFLPDTLVRLSLSTMDKSILIESLQDDHYQYIIMPMKL